MEQRLILRGFASGALSGLLAFVFGRILAEPVIQRAIDYENGRDAAESALRRAAGLAAAAHDPELFSRGLQRNAGFSIAMVLFGVAMGGLLAVAYALIARSGRPRVRGRGIAPAIAAAGFAGFFLLPFLKYPADPPGLGRAETIHTRGLLYLAMVAISVLSVLAAVLAARRLKAELGSRHAAVVALVALAGWMAIVMAVLPSLEPPQPLRDPSGAVVYPGFPDDVLFQFRLCAIGAQLILWSTLGLAFGALAERLMTGAAAPSARPERTVDALS
ncbi:MAG TPA: CbtA family protein [Thermoleophilaceae bacterium]|nr:CbtA family protein [Thermoleophilaceae bacterium]